MDSRPGYKKTRYKYKIFTPNVVHRYIRYGELANSAILSARNLDAEEIDNPVVKLFDKTTERIYKNVHSVKNCDYGEMNEGLLSANIDTLNPVNLPPHELRLRTNANVTALDY